MTGRGKNPGDTREEKTTIIRLYVLYLVVYALLSCWEQGSSLAEKNTKKQKAGKKVPVMVSIRSLQIMMTDDSNPSHLLSVSLTFDRCIRPTASSLVFGLFIGRSRAAGSIGKEGFLRFLRHVSTL